MNQAGLGCFGLPASCAAFLQFYRSTLISALKKALSKDYESRLRKGYKNVFEKHPRESVSKKRLRERREGTPKFSVEETSTKG